MKKEAELAWEFFYEGLLRPWRDNRRLTDIKWDLMIYVGRYQGFDGLFTMSVVEDREAATFGSKLAIVFNQREATRQLMVFYQKDTYSLFLQD
jgi:hypothetical protein